MAIYTNLPIYKSAYSLLLALTRISPNLPRDCRYSIGQEVRNKAMEIILLVYKANKVRGKTDVISQMQDCLLQAQVYIRVMCDLKYISEGCYSNLTEYTTSISKQLSAWYKSECKKKSDDTVNEI